MSTQETTPATLPSLLDRIIAAGIPKAAALTFLKQLGTRTPELEKVPPGEFYARVHALRAELAKETIGAQIKGQKTGEATTNG